LGPLRRHQSNERYLSPFYVVCQTACLPIMRNRVSEAADDAGIARKQRATRQHNAAVHPCTTGISSEFAVRPPHCMRGVDTTCDKFDNR